LGGLGLIAVVVIGIGGGYALWVGGFYQAVVLSYLWQEITVLQQCYMV